MVGRTILHLNASLDQPPTRLSVPADTPIISARCLRRQFGMVTAIEGLTVSIRPGITGLVGANGAGKSTFIRILLGLLNPDDGDVKVLGHDVRSARRQIQRLVGYMPEHDCLPPEMSGAEFVAFVGRLSGLPSRAARERGAEVLSHVGVLEERYQPIGGLSAGMVQRVKLAQALVHDPGLLILDEPTHGLDPAGRDLMLELISRTGREFNIPVLLSSHISEEVERTCDRVVQLEAGRLVRDEAMGDLTAETATLFIEIDGDRVRFMSCLTRRMAGLTAENQAASTITEGHAGSVSGNRWLTGKHGGILLRVPSDVSSDAVADAVRDAAVETSTGLLRMERCRERLDHIFRRGANSYEIGERPGGMVQ